MNNTTTIPNPDRKRTRGRQDAHDSKASIQFLNLTALCPEHGIFSGSRWVSQAQRDARLNSLAYLER